MIGGHAWRRVNNREPALSPVQPPLYQIGTAALSAEDIASRIHEILAREATVHMERFTHVDTRSRNVFCGDPPFLTMLRSSPRDPSPAISAMKPVENSLRDLRRWTTLLPPRELSCVTKPSL